jgi:hypothetical protein
MTIDKNSGASFPSASEYILDNFESQLTGSRCCC